MVTPEKVRPMLALLSGIYGTDLAGVIRIPQDRLDFINHPRCKEVDPDDARAIVNAVLASRRAEDPLGNTWESDVQRRLPTREEQDLMRRHRNRIEQAHHRAKRAAEETEPE